MKVTTEYSEPSFTPFSITIEFDEYQEADAFHALMNVPSVCEAMLSVGGWSPERIRFVMGSHGKFGDSFQEVARLIES